MTECEKIQEKLSEMLDGELSAAEEAEVRAHIARCPDCAALYAAFSAVSEAAAEPEEPPETLHAAVMDRVRRAEKAARFQRNFRRWRPAAISAAALIVVVGTVFAVGRATLFSAKSGAPNASMTDETLYFACPEDGEVSSAETEADSGDVMSADFMPQFSIMRKETPAVLTVRITGQTEDGSVAVVLRSDCAEAGTTVYLYWTEDTPAVPVPGTELTVRCTWYDAQTGECWDTAAEENG